MFGKVVFLPKSVSHLSIGESLENLQKMTLRQRLSTGNAFSQSSRVVLKDSTKDAGQDALCTMQNICCFLYSMSRIANEAPLLSIIMNMLMLPSVTCSHTSSHKNEMNKAGASVAGQGFSLPLFHPPGHGHKQVP